MSQRIEKCPQCGASVIQPREGGDYCEECGWPDENRPANQNYVVGFMFDSSMSNVALIRKQKPAWQAGLLNGIGGKIESGETAAEAMAREFKEEAGLDIPRNQWKKFCFMVGTNNDGLDFSVDCYFCKGDLSQLRSMEAEQIELVESALIATDGYKTIGNVPWLVALAVDFGKGIHPPNAVAVTY